LSNSLHHKNRTVDFHNNESKWGPKTTFFKISFLCIQQNKETQTGWEQH